jgi:DNA polymerase
VIDIIKEYPPAGAAEVVELLHGDVPMSVSSCLRAHLTVKPGKQMYVADFSNIEGRVACWFGGEDWKMQAFRDFDAGTGPDLYKVTAAQILGTTPDQIDKTRRNVMGKVPELALGFEGGAGAFQSMAAIYHVNMADYWDIIRDSLDSQFVRKAYDHWELFGSRSGMDQEAWLASETVKLAWRDRHPGIAQCWKDCERNAIKALQNPGRWFRFADNRLAFGAKEINGVMFLIGRLPSGRLIYKAHACLKTVNQFGRDQAKIHYMGVDSITRRWVRMTTYSGDLFQSFVQGCAYDMMMAGWANVEKAGYEVILSVHDEIGAEAEPGRPVEEFERLMSALPTWAEGCPVSAEGYVATRYRKDD